MIKTEIVLLTNNVVIPFQILGLDFIKLNKMFATKSIAEHGLGFLINIYDKKNSEEQYTSELKKQIIFDTGSTNFTFLHNYNIRGYSYNDVGYIVLSHWHYDHVSGLYKILEQANQEISIICHEHANFERFFKRSMEVKNSDLKGKTRQEILPLLSSSKIVNQEPINLTKIEELGGKVIFSKKNYELLDTGNLKIIVSGEINRKYEDEDFDNFFSLQDGILKEDKILDDKCLILEFKKNVVVLNGCCHSGLKNTLDHVKKLVDKPISHIIGGFHMASASNIRIKNTIEYLKSFQKYDEPLFLFPIHCSGENFIREINKKGNDKIKAFNPSVGTIFKF